MKFFYYVFLLFVILSLIFLNDAKAQNCIDYMSLDKRNDGQAKKVAMDFHMAMQEHFYFFEDEVLEKKLKDILNTMIHNYCNKSSELEFDVKIIVDAEPNIFAGPDNTLYISTGLLNTIKSLDELKGFFAIAIESLLKNTPYRYFRSQKTKKIVFFTCGTLLSLVTAVGIGVAGASASSSAASEGSWAASESIMMKYTLISDFLVSLIASTTSFFIHAAPSTTSKIYDLSSQISALSNQLEVAKKNKDESSVYKIEKRLRVLQKKQKALLDLLPLKKSVYLGNELSVNNLFNRLRLAHNEVLLYIIDTEDILLSVLIKDNKILNVTTPNISLAKLKIKTNSYLELVKNPQKKIDYTLGKELFNLLILPHLNYINNNDTLVIIRPYWLETLPFEALIVKIEGNKPVYLGEKIRTRYESSLTAMILEKDNKNRKYDKFLLYVGDPIYEKNDENNDRSCSNDHFQNFTLFFTQDESNNFFFTQLPSTSRLAKELQNELPNNSVWLLKKDATEKEVVNNLKKFSFKYIIFATHGVLSKEIPGLLEPAVVLSNPSVNIFNPNNDGFFSVSDIISLNINADFVLLTACSTGLGRNVKGEGVMSLGRAFRYAGVKSVLVSLWPVEDESTNLLTKRIIRLLQEGYSKTDAVFLSRKEIMNTSTYSHPYFWSAFILSGDG